MGVSVFLNNEQVQELWCRREAFLQEKRPTWTLKTMWLPFWLFLPSVVLSQFARSVVIVAGVVFGISLFDGVVTYVIWRQWSRADQKTLFLRRLATVMTLQFRGVMLLVFSFASLLAAVVVADSGGVVYIILGASLLSIVLTVFYTPRILRSRFQEPVAPPSPMVLKQAAVIQSSIVGLAVFLSTVLSGNIETMLVFILNMLGGFLTQPVGVYCSLQVAILIDDWV